MKGRHLCGRSRKQPVCLFVCLFLGPHPQHMEIPRLGVELKLQLGPYTAATATPDPSHVCNLQHSSQLCQILNPLSMARDQTRNLMVPSWVLWPPSHDGNFLTIILKNCLKTSVPIIAQQKWIRLGTMRLHVRSLASLSGLRIQRCHELWCRSKTRLGSDIAVAVV